MLFPSTSENFLSYHSSTHFYITMYSFRILSQWSSNRQARTSLNTNILYKPANGNLQDLTTCHLILKDFINLFIIFFFLSQVGGHLKRPQLRHHDWSEKIQNTLKLPTIVSHTDIGYLRRSILLLNYFLLWFMRHYDIKIANVSIIHWQEMMKMLECWNF